MVNGGTGWREGWDPAVWPISLFVFLLGYNAVRFLLLWKTKTLELEQETSGLPADFSLDDGRWRLVYRLAYWGMLVNILAVLWHTFHFLTQRIPL